LRSRLRAIGSRHMSNMVSQARRANIRIPFSAMA
jgi:hypothetical protein